MKIIESGISGLRVCAPTVFGDARGWFAEVYNAREFAGLGMPATFVQDNHSMSRRGILRGLHYQIRQSQDKLVRCLAGAILDVAVDLRKGSPTFGQGFAVEISAENKKLVFIPKGFAHGFLTLSDTAEVLYKVSDYWAKEHERGIRWDDPAIGIAWPDLGIPPQLNARDAGFPCLAAVPAADLFAWDPAHPEGIGPG